MTTKTFVVVFRTGGEVNFEWHRSVAFEDRALADRTAAQIRQGGRPALVVDAKLSLAVGLPETFDAESR